MALYSIYVVLIIYSIVCSKLSLQDCDTDVEKACIDNQWRAVFYYNKICYVLDNKVDQWQTDGLNCKDYYDDYSADYGRAAVFFDGNTYFTVAQKMQQLVQANSNNYGFGTKITVWLGAQATTSGYSLTDYCWMKAPDASTKGSQVSASYTPVTLVSQGGPLPNPSATTPFCLAFNLADPSKFYGSVCSSQTTYRMICELGCGGAESKCKGVAPAGTTCATDAAACNLDYNMTTATAFYNTTITSQSSVASSAWLKANATTLTSSSIASTKSVGFLATTPGAVAFDENCDVSQSCPMTVPQNPSYRYGDKCYVLTEASSTWLNGSNACSRHANDWFNRPMTYGRAAVFYNNEIYTDVMTNLRKLSAGYTVANGNTNGGLILMNPQVWLGAHTTVDNGGTHLYDYCWMSSPTATGSQVSTSDTVVTLPSGSATPASSANPYCLIADLYNPSRFYGSQCDSAQYNNYMICEFGCTKENATCLGPAPEETSTGYSCSANGPCTLGINITVGSTLTNIYSSTSTSQPASTSKSQTLTVTPGASMSTTSSATASSTNSTPNPSFASTASAAAVTPSFTMSIAQSTLSDASLVSTSSLTLITSESSTLSTLLTPISAIVSTTQSSSSAESIVSLTTTLTTIPSSSSVTSVGSTSLSASLSPKPATPDTTPSSFTTEKILNPTAMATSNGTNQTSPNFSSTIKSTAVLTPNVTMSTSQNNVTASDTILASTSSLHLMSSSTGLPLMDSTVSTAFVETSKTPYITSSASAAVITSTVYPTLASSKTSQTPTALSLLSSLGSTLGFASQKQSPSTNAAFSESTSLLDRSAAAITPSVSSKLDLTPSTSALFSSVSFTSNNALLVVLSTQGLSLPVTTLSSSAVSQSSVTPMELSSSLVTEKPTAQASPVITSSLTTILTPSTLRRRTTSRRVPTLSSILSISSQLPKTLTTVTPAASASLTSLTSFSASQLQLSSRTVDKTTKIITELATASATDIGSSQPLSVASAATVVLPTTLTLVSPVNANNLQSTSTKSSKLLTISQQNSMSSLVASSSAKTAPTSKGTKENTDTSTTSQKDQVSYDLSSSWLMTTAMRDDNDKTTFATDKLATSSAIIASKTTQTIPIRKTISGQKNSLSTSPQSISNTKFSIINFSFFDITNNINKQSTAEVADAKLSTTARTVETQYSTTITASLRRYFSTKTFFKSDTLKTTKDVSTSKAKLTSQKYQTATQENAATFYSLGSTTSLLTSHNNITAVINTEKISTNFYVNSSTADSASENRNAVQSSSIIKAMTLLTQHSSNALNEKQRTSTILRHPSDVRLAKSAKSTKAYDDPDLAAVFESNMPSKASVLADTKLGETFAHTDNTQTITFSSEELHDAAIPMISTASNKLDEPLLTTIFQQHGANTATKRSIPSLLAHEQLFSPDTESLNIDITRIRKSTLDASLPIQVSESGDSTLDSLNTASYMNDDKVAGAMTKSRHDSNLFVSTLNSLGNTFDKNTNTSTNAIINQSNAFESGYSTSYNIGKTVGINIDTSNDARSTSRQGHALESTDSPSNSFNNTFGKHTDTSTESLTLSQITTPNTSDTKIIAAFTIFEKTSTIAAIAESRTPVVITSTKQEDTLKTSISTATTSKVPYLTTTRRPLSTDDNPFLSTTFSEDGCQETWSPYSSCGSTCGDAVKSRQRKRYHLSNELFDCLIENETVSCELPKCNPMNEVQQIISSFMMNIGCIWILIGLGLAILTFVLLRNRYYLQVIHVNEDISLFLAHLLLLIFAVRNDDRFNITVCKVAALGLQYFFSVTFMFQALEALHIHTVLSDVVLGDDAIIGIKTALAIGWGTPIVITGITGAVAFDKLMSDFSCWMNVGDIVILATIIPIATVAWVTAILLEATGHGKTNRKSYNVTSCRLAHGGLNFVFGAQFASWLMSWTAIYYQNVGLFTVVFGFNAMLGLFIYMYHVFSNQKVRVATKNLYRRVRKKPVIDQS